ncbi:septum formation inhibitor Maf, partial [Stenotrophomonas maltophilia]
MLYLASRSPRRNQLLARLGRPFQALDLEVVEQRAPAESAEQ